MNFHRLKRQRDLKQQAGAKNPNDCAHCKAWDALGPLYSDRGVLSRTCTRCGFTAILNDTGVKR